MKKKALLNILLTILCQFVTILSGLILPRIILSTFGSEVNGLISSLTQFLNYIALVEGGIGGVVLASLYSPLARKDNRELNSVLKASNGFFKKIAYIYLIYAVLIGIIYPFIINTSFSWMFIFSLTMILSIGLFVQYFFSISYKILLQADQKMYIVQALQIITTIINMIVVICVIRVFPKIHIIKLIGSTIFLIQPIFYSAYVNKHYKIALENAKPNKHALSQRWACFGQNLAYFIHSNTDVVVLSLFKDLKMVSVYSIHNVIIGHLKSLFKSLSHAFSPIIGKSLALKRIDKTNKYLNIYEFSLVYSATIIFGCCSFLISSFCLIFTKGVTDANYFQPIFAYLLTFSEFFYVLWDPYLSVVYGASKFKETSKNSYIEAFLNIIISILLVRRFGLIGIAFGTLVGVIYRLVFLVEYSSKKILNRSVTCFYKRMAISLSIIVISTGLSNLLIKHEYYSFIRWIFNGIYCFSIFSIVTILFVAVFERKTIISLLINKKENGD